MRIRIVGEIQKEQLSIDEVVGNLQKEGGHSNQSADRINVSAKRKNVTQALVLKFRKH
jgi:hypothetical protein